MEGNKKKSLTSKSRHIHISYLFVKDRVDSNDMPIAYFSIHVSVLGEKFCNKPGTEFFAPLIHFKFLYW